MEPAYQGRLHPFTLFRPGLNGSDAKGSTSIKLKSCFWADASGDVLEKQNQADHG